jgi:membrane fusion protein, multidrug efflux system
VVSRDGKAEYREVALGASLEGRRVVQSGLKPGDRVILDGLQKLGPGAPVAPQPERRASR